MTTIREFINELEDIARMFGDSALVVVSHDDGDEPSPSMTAGPTLDGSPPTVRIF